MRREREVKRRGEGGIRCGGREKKRRKGVKEGYVVEDRERRVERQSRV